jgi:hypothetical protein
MELNSQIKDSPWLGYKTAEVLFILLPGILSCLAVIVFKDYFESETDVNPVWWLILVLGIDVSHVYSTLYRTYFEEESFKQNRDLYTYTPIACLVIGIMLYSIHPMAFWRCLAYLAVFHFMRQQYGIMKLYERKEVLSKGTKWLNTISIYAAVLYPILFWHLEPNRQFSWFVEGDFLLVSSPLFIQIISWAYGILVMLFVINTLYLLVQKKQFNLPKNIWIISTMATWYIGIVAFNTDLIFTSLNIVSHGIPYMALIWIYGRKKSSHQEVGGFLKHLFSNYGIVLFVLILLGFAFIEEALWDAMVWREHDLFFKDFWVLPHFTETSILSILVPLLSLPQVTHYVLDAYIWKVRKPETMPHLIT